MTGQNTITVIIHSGLIKSSRGKGQKKFEMPIREDYRIEDVVRDLDIQDEKPSLLYGLNGETADDKDLLRPGDTVHLMLPISGG